MKPSEIRDYARAGVRGLIQRGLEEFPELRTEFMPAKKENDAPLASRHQPRRMSPEARKKISKRMKAMWAEKRRNG